MWKRMRAVARLMTRPIWQSQYETYKKGLFINIQVQLWSIAHVNLAGLQWNVIYTLIFINLLVCEIYVDLVQRLLSHYILFNIDKCKLTDVFLHFIGRLIDELDSNITLSRILAISRKIFEYHRFTKIYTRKIFQSLQICEINQLFDNEGNLWCIFHSESFV